MNPRTEELLRKHFPSEQHPYRHFENSIRRLIGGQSVLLDAGCGYSAELADKFTAQARRVIGVDVVPFSPPARRTSVLLLNSDLRKLAIKSGSVDVVASRSVLEHLDSPLAVFQEVHRVLRPGGAFIFLTPNLWHYSALMSHLIPNRFHTRIVKAVEGRAEADTFPTRYRANTVSAIVELCAHSGFQLASCDRLSQYPNYFLFSPVLFRLGTAYEKLVGWPVLKGFRAWLLVVLLKPSASPRD